MLLLESCEDRARACEAAGKCTAYQACNARTCMGLAFLLPPVIVAANLVPHCMTIPTGLIFQAFLCIIAIAAAGD